MAPATASKAEARSDGRSRPPRCDSPSPRSSQVAQVEPVGEAGQAGRAHDRRPARRQGTFVVGRPAVVQGRRDRQRDDGIAEVLEAFVVAADRAAMLVQVAAVDERPAEELGVADREPEVGREVDGRGHRVGGPVGSGRAGRIARRSGPRRCARRCTRPRRRRSGSARRPRRRSRSRTLPRDS